jgi:hypothetical protein
MYEIRFNLGAGANYRKWKIKAYDGSVQYLDPARFQIEMINATLINKKNKAKKVHAAGVKDVCGWIECEDYHLHFAGEAYAVGFEEIKFNPIVRPEWTRGGDDFVAGWDDHEFSCLITDGRKVFVAEEKCRLTMV